MARTILLADDSPTIRKIVELTFGEPEYRTVTVGSGAEALELLPSLRPDLVVADAVMPDPTGYEVCRRVKASAQPCPVLLLAGTFEPFDARQARDCGADAHLVKPFETGRLRAEVDRLLLPPVPIDAPVAAPSEDPDVEEVLDDLERSPRPRSAEPAPSGPSPADSFEPEAGFVEEIARAVVRILAPDVLREVAREVVPDLAREIIRERIRELEEEEPPDA